MANPNDVVRDAILRHLYLVHSKARSPKTAGLMIRELTQALKPKGFKQQEVASNLDYLVQKGWVREVVENRSFTTPRGTTASRKAELQNIGFRDRSHRSRINLRAHTDEPAHQYLNH